MHTHVVLHLACVVAAGASPGNIGIDISRIGDIPVDLGHVLIEPALLDEVLRADRADMGLFSGMLLLVVVHGVLLGCSEIAIIEGACKLTCLVLDIHYGCHAFVGGPWAPLQVFTCRRLRRFVRVFRRSFRFLFLLPPEITHEPAPILSSEQLFFRGIGLETNDDALVAVSEVEADLV